MQPGWSILKWMAAEYGVQLGSTGQGTNWYNKDYAGNQLWSQQNYTRWHVATTALPTTNNSKLRLRFVFKSDESLTKMVLPLMIFIFMII